MTAGVEIDGGKRDGRASEVNKAGTPPRTRSVVIASSAATTAFGEPLLNGAPLVYYAPSLPALWPPLLSARCRP